MLVPELVPTIAKCPNEGTKEAEGSYRRFEIRMVVARSGKSDESRSDETPKEQRPFPEVFQFKVQCPHARLVPVLLSTIGRTTRKRRTALRTKLSTFGRLSLALRTIHGAPPL